MTHRTNLQITQFTSIATVPTIPARFWGGTQDNGTVRKSTASDSWFDVASGDGGQVLVDPTDANYVYGTYFGITPYRYTDGGNFFTNQSITGGINLNDRAEFYVPVGDEPGQPEPAVPRHLPALPHRQRQGARCRSGDLGTDQPGPDQRLHRSGAQRRARLHLGGRSGRRRGRRLHRL